jgi:hypothetical protein
VGVFQYLLAGFLAHSGLGDQSPGKAFPSILDSGFPNLFAAYSGGGRFVYEFPITFVSTIKSHCHYFCPYFFVKLCIISF